MVSQYGSALETGSLQPWKPGPAGGGAGAGGGPGGFLHVPVPAEGGTHIHTFTHSAHSHIGVEGSNQLATRGKGGNGYKSVGAVLCSARRL